MFHERYTDGGCAVLTTQMSDARTNLAKYKGMVEAIETAQIKNECKGA
ncbi:hypothetical protein HUE58_00545 [Candidatus Ruthia endofausta]|uniref:Uncharacterized protein n=1 Tax=Candidatus Ruthia endofausta TaxID=2738852 RepID=A0A6N0HN65_9GAMM|nr:hypothetical protein [Candidatus Ruthia endofausta]QKQ23717.1 hypothetical protein HUE58_00545 [Candidatus Ruthia endofausta]